MTHHKIPALQADRPNWLRLSITGCAVLVAMALSACSTTPSAYSQAGSRLSRSLSVPANTSVQSAQTNLARPASAQVTPRDSGSNQANASAGQTVATTNRFITNDDLLEATGRPLDPDRPDAALILNGLDAQANLWDRVRQGFALPPMESELVKAHEQYYASRPDYVARMTERANRYLYHVFQEVRQRNMPSELALLPFIESAFNPTAMSSARASGIWQFMPATGRDYALKQNLFRDDRRDVLASTRAALDYLSRLYRMFGDWHLALAAYNWGEGNVQRAINRNMSLGLPTDYLSLNMPAETRNYVPKLHAVRNIVADPQQFGLKLTRIENHPYFLSVPIQRDMDVELAARLAGVSMDDFKELNPSMNKPVILAAGTPQILLPFDNAERFISNLKQYRGQLASWTAWVAPRTMKTAEAARMVGLNEAELRDLNKIPQRMLVKSGSTLLVPRSEHREQDVSESIADNAMISLAPDVPPVKRIVVKAGKRDTVAGMAKRYRLPVAQVAQWNRLPQGARFKRYQAVVLYVPVGSSLRDFASASSGKRVAQAPARLSKAAKGRQLAQARQRPNAKRAETRVASRSKQRTQVANARGGKRVRVAMAPH